jgi:hypothetical protein
MAKTAKDYLDCEARLETDRQYWKNQWQLTAEYVHQRKADFTTSRQPGAFISSNLWTDDPAHMAETSASAFLGYIWSAGVKSFKLVANPTLWAKNKEMQQFFSDATETLQDEMDETDAGLPTSLDESMLDDIVLGTSAILIEERNQDDPQLACLQFAPWSVLEFSLDENGVGRADTFYRRHEYSVRTHVDKYGYKNVSKKVRDLYDRQQYDEKVCVLHVIEPRMEKDRKPGSKAAKDMPYASVHIEVDSKFICKNSGYPELPVACSRLAKRIKEKYGRGRGMNALPTIMLLNQVWEDLMLAMEKKLDPPMYVVNDAVSGNGTIDTSAGAVNVLRIDKAIPSIPPTGKLFDIQDTSQVSELIEKLQNTISNHFMIDRLINMNNDREMTAREALLRNAIRQSTLRSIVSRLLQEKFEVIINTSFMICLRRGRFGFMPGDPRAIAMEQRGIKVKYLPDEIIDAIENNENLYKIEYMTPAARDLMAEEGQAMIETLEVAGQMANFDQSIPERIDAQWTLARYAEIRGANYKMFRKEKDVEKRIAQREEAQQQAQQAQMAQMMASAARDGAQAQQATNPQTQ